MKKFWIKVKLIFSKRYEWLISDLQKNDDVVKHLAPTAIRICNFLKEYNGSAIAVDLEKFLTGLGNPVIKEGVNVITTILSDAVLDKIIAALNIADKAASVTNAADKLTLILNYVKTLETSQRAIAWTTVSSAITSALTDGKISWLELYGIVKKIYASKSN